MKQLDEIEQRVTDAEGSGYRATPWRPIVSTDGERHGVVAEDGCLVTTGDRAVAALLAHAPTDLLKMVAALRSIEALHAPDQDGDCPGCRAECMYCEADHPWPCPPIKAIHQAFNLQ